MDLFHFWVQTEAVQRQYNSGYYSGLWTRRFLVRVPSGYPYSMRLDRSHRAYPSLHSFGVVYWVPVLSNSKTATGCESNRQLQLWTVFAGTIVNNYQFNGVHGWAMSNKMPGCHIANAWISRSKHILQLQYNAAMKYQFNQLTRGWRTVNPTDIAAWNLLSLWNYQRVIIIWISWKTGFHGNEGYWPSSLGWLLTNNNDLEKFQSLEGYSLQSWRHARFWWYSSSSRPLVSLLIE